MMNEEILLKSSIFSKRVQEKCSSEKMRILAFFSKRGESAG